MLLLVVLSFCSDIVADYSNHRPLLLKAQDWDSWQPAGALIDDVLLLGLLSSCFLRPAGSGKLVSGDCFSEELQMPELNKLLHVRLAELEKALTSKYLVFSDCLVLRA